MENLVKKISSTTTAWIALVIIVLSITSFFVFKLNLGPEFSSSRVLIAQLDHEESLSDVTARAKEILLPSEVIKESTSKFYFSFQNITDTEIINFTEKFKESQAGVLTISDYNFSYAGEIFIAERVIFIGFVSIVVYLIYVAFTYRGIGLKRIDLWPLVSIEIFTLAFSTIVLLGVGSLIGSFGVIMNTQYWLIFLLAIAVVMIFRVYTLLRFRDMLKREGRGDVIAVYKQMYKKYWPEFVFIFCLAIVICLLPLLVLGLDQAISAVLVLVALLLSMYNFIFLQRHFLGFMNEWSLAPIKKLNSKSKLLKKW